MARTGIARLLPLLVAALAAGAAGAAPGHAATPEATPPQGTPEAVDWRLDQVGRLDARSLDLIAYGSSCIEGRTTAHVEETAAAIRIRVTADVGGLICTADYGAHPLTVRLDGAIAGRPIRGARQLATDRSPVGPPGRRAARVPRVLGLSPGDAAAAVRGHGLRPVVERVADLRARPRVVGQSPGSGATRRFGAAVTLFVSR